MQFFSAGANFPFRTGRKRFTSHTEWVSFYSVHAPSTLKMAGQTVAVKNIYSMSHETMKWICNERMGARLALDCFARVRARFSASCILTALRCIAMRATVTKKTEAPARLVNASQIFTTISPCLPTCFLRRLKNDVARRDATGRTQYFLAHYIGAQFRRSRVYYSHRLAADRIKAAVSSWAFLQWQYLSREHVEVAVWKSVGVTL